MESIKTSIHPILTRKRLIRENRFPAPFQFSLEDSSEVIYCDEIVRMVPGKRLVAFGKLGERPVVIKLFFGKMHAKRQCERDFVGVQLLTQANVPTSACLYRGSSDNHRIHILIYKKITDAVCLETLWRERKKGDELIPIMRALIVEMATQHVLGILQHDLHFKNFLVGEKCIYTIDGGQISSVPGPLDKKTSLDNLCLLLVQLGPGNVKLQESLFALYAKSRGWMLKPSDKKAFQSGLRFHKKEQWRRYQKKLFRSCSAFERIDQFTKSMMYDREYESDEFLNCLKNPEKFFSLPRTLFLKKGRSSTIAKVSVNNRLLVVKRYNIKNIWHGLRRLFRTTRARKSWTVAQRLSASGIKTAKPVAYVENHLLGFRGKSYFIMEYVAGQNIGDYFSTFPHENMEQYKEIVLNFFKLLQNLSESCITHGDLKMTNILIENAELYLIDLDGVAEHYSFNAARLLNREIKRFMKNWEGTPDVYAFFKDCQTGSA